MPGKSRVLVFTTAFRPMIGGSEIALEEIIRRLPDIFFDIVTPRHKRDFKVLETGGNFNVHRVGAGAGVADKIAFPVLGFFKAVGLMRNSNYDAMHAYQASYGGGAAWLLKMFNFNLPFMLTMQEGKKLDEQIFLLNWLRRLIIRKADLVTVISSHLGEYVKRAAKNKKVFLIPNGVNLKNFQFSISPDGKVIEDPRQSRDKFQSNFNFQNLKSENSRTIITVSRLVPKNGIGDLIKAFHILNSEFGIQNSKLLIIGDGPQREELFKLVSDFGLQNNVEFLGSVPNEKIYDHLASSFVFVRPSLSEGLGTAFLEAMAAGIPVIGTPVGGIPDFLKDGETGLFCKQGDPKDIAEKINLILSDNDLREKLISNGRKLVEDKYNWDKIAEEFKKLYGSI